MIKKFDQEFKDRVVRLVESRVTSEGVSIRTACWGGSQARDFASPRKCGVSKHIKPGKSVKPRKVLSASLQNSAGKIRSFVTRMNYLKLFRFFRLRFSGVFLLNRPITAGFQRLHAATERLVRRSRYHSARNVDDMANIKSHHNMGGLPRNSKFELIELLRKPFKDGVRALGRELGLPDVIVNHRPFPSPGLAIRIIGEVNEECLRILQTADLIVREELSATGLDTGIQQCPVVLLADVYLVGVQGDGRTYGHPIMLRPVSSEDAMTAD